MDNSTCSGISALPDEMQAKHGQMLVKPDNNRSCLSRPFRRPSAVYSVALGMPDGISMALSSIDPSYNRLAGYLGVLHDIDRLFGTPNKMLRDLK